MLRNIQSNIKECWRQLEKIQGEDPTQENLSKEASIYLNLQEWLQREETLWREKSRNIKSAATNLITKFFHLSTIIRRRNVIDFLKN